MFCFLSALNDLTEAFKSFVVIHGSISFLILACLTVAKAVKLTKFSISAPEQPSKNVAAYVMSSSFRL